MSTTNNITVTELHERMSNGSKPAILDVREYFEYDLVNLEGILIPLGELLDRLYEIDEYKDKELVIHCRTGSRSGEAVQILLKNGFKNPRNLTGGINEWAHKIDSSMPIL